jgi:hypothetical protein
MDSRRKPLDHAGDREPTTGKSGIAFGDGQELFKHPPTEARFWARPGRRLSRATESPLVESGFGGWVDEKLNQLREADAESLIHNI